MKKRKSSKKTPTQKRAEKKYPGLNKALHPRTRQEYMDADYIDKLSPKEKEFLSKFQEEYYGASLAPEDSPKQWKKDLHKTKELRKECRDRNNARNRDLYSISRTHGWVTSYEENKDVLDEGRKIQGDLEEQAIIFKIDAESNEGNE
jgi:hypothetical protein